MTVIPPLLMLTFHKGFLEKHGRDPEAHECFEFLDKRYPDGWSVRQYDGTIKTSKEIKQDYVEIELLSILVDYAIEKGYIS